MDFDLCNLSMIRLYSEYCGFPSTVKSVVRIGVFSIPDVRYGLGAGSCRVHLGWDCVLIWSSYSRVRGYCIVRCATPGLRSLRLFVVVWPSSLYLSCCLLFELSRWGVISIGSKSSFGCPRLICNLIRG